MRPKVQMEEGKRYLIVYRRVGGRVLDECVAQYLGDDTLGGTHSLNLRPKAGTSSLPFDNVVSAELTTAPIMLPRRHRGDLELAEAGR